MNKPRRDGWTRLLEFDELDEALVVSPLVEVPEDLATLTSEDLDALLAELIDRFDEIHAGDLTVEAVAQLGELKDAILALRAEGARRETVAAETEAAVDALAAEVHPAETTDEEPGRPDTESEEERREREEREERERREREGEQPAEAEAETVVPDAVITPAPAPVAVPIAAAARPALGAIRRSAPQPSRQPGRREERLPVTITAAADVPGLSTGSRVDTMDRVALAFHDRARMMSDGQRAQICRIDYPIPEADTIDASTNAQDVIDRVRAVPSGGIEALVASGGWCGPLTPLYNLCRIDAADGMINLPTVRVARAGIQVPSPITIPADMSTVSWKWTNANDVAAAPPATTPRKPCIKIPCPTWTDYVLAAYGICVTAGNLQDRSFPELTREYIGMVMNAHLHAMNAEQIATIEAGSTAITGPAVGSATSSIQSAADLAAEFYREKYHMASSATLDTVFPAWVRTTVRSDLAARAGVDLLAVSDAQVNAQFTARNIRPIFVQDWQQLANATAFPTSVKMLMYPPGTWVVGSGGTLDLGVTRDSTLNASNDFTAAWSEDFMLVAKVCTESLVVTVTVATNGVTACCP